MRIKHLVIACAITSVAVSAQAATIAGWDFSQFLGSGTLSTDGQSLTNVLNANYSSLDPTNNAGAESAAFGRLYFNGQFGSSSVTPVGDGSEPFTPVGGSLVSNLSAPVAGLGDNPFDSLGILTNEGQVYGNLLSMGATAQVAVVFAADLTSVSGIASDWTVTFGGRAGNTSPLRIDYSSNGVDYVTAGSVNLGTADTPYSVNLSALPGDRAFVRFSFTPPTSGAQFIDNVAIQGAVTPEPAVVGLLFASLVGLVAVRARRA